MGLFRRFRDRHRSEAKAESSSQGAQSETRFEGNSADQGAQLFGNTFNNATISLGKEMSVDEKMAKKALEYQQQKECLWSLSFPNIDSRRLDIANPYPKTCNWIFETEVYREWEAGINLDSHNRVLWIKGKPGAGKSTLMKHAWHQTTSKFGNCIIAAYFFHARGGILEKSPLGMFRSILYQILDQDPDLLEQFMRIYKAKNNKHAGSWEWHLSELQEFMWQGVFKRSTIIFIDALDECADDEVRDVVNFLSDFSAHAVKRSDIRICLSSRHYPRISMPKNLSLTVEERTEHDEDIDVYIRKKLVVQQNDFIESISNKARGVFLWVILVVELINRAYDEGDLEAASAALEDIPEDLDELFGLILQRGKTNFSRTLLIFQWLLFVKEPISCSALYVAIADSKAQVDEKIMESFLITSSKGLVEMKGSDRKVQFIHETVRDFLLRGQRLQSLLNLDKARINPACHDILARKCLTYNLEATKAPQAEWADQTKWPLLWYASKHGLSHAIEAQENDTEQYLIGLLQKGNVILQFDKPNPYIPTAPSTSMYSNKEAVHLRPILSALARAGFEEALKALLQSPKVKIEEDTGAYIDRSVLSNVGTGTALHSAAFAGREKSVSMLLSAGANVNAKAFDGSTPLCFAAFQGLKQIVRTLLAAGANINAVGKRYGTALQAAAGQQHQDVVNILLQFRADVNIEGGLQNTALYAACSTGTEEIVKVLLRAGAIPNIPHPEDGSPLYVAALKGRRGIVNLLLDAGAKVNGPGGTYGTALGAAAAAKSHFIVKMLLEAGANVDARCGNEGSALCVATSIGQGAIVQTLVDAGADVNKKDGKKQPPLYIAISSGYAEIVGILLAAGADTRVVYGNAASVLSFAAASGKADIVRILLDVGHDANRSDRKLGTALHAAVQSENASEELVRVLVQAGADPNATCELYGSVWDAAGSRGKRNQGIDNLLLVAGAVPTK